MGTPARAADYKSEARHSTFGGRNTSPGPEPVRLAWRPGEATGVEEFLQLLARAILQFHTYPPTSPLCRSAVDACLRSLVALEGREEVTFRVTPAELLVDEAPIGRGTLVEAELARRLHAAFVAGVTIGRDASVREITRFCLDLIRCTERRSEESSLMDLLAEHGVDRIVLQPAYRPEVLGVAVPQPSMATLVDHERERWHQQLAAGAAVTHLYPPGKGWVRIDPTSAYDKLSLVDLALLAGEPTTLASMLMRLTEGKDADPESQADALTQKYSDVATLFAALDPRVARVMFAKLARAVLDLDPEPRQQLLRQTILPGLLDEKVDGAVLQAFPDPDLAESLCLLLDLEVAAPEIVSTAFAKLNLPEERKAALAPVVEEQLRVRSSSAKDRGLHAHAQRLIKIEPGRAASYAEFAAYELALDDLTRNALGEIRAGIASTDIVVDQLGCLWNLTRLEPNPELAQRFIERARPLLDTLEREQRTTDLALWLEKYRDLANALAEPRPDVADIIGSALAAFCTEERIQNLLVLAERDEEGRTAARRLLHALGAGAAPLLLAAAADRSGERRAASRAALQLLCDEAVLMAPPLAAAIGTAGPAGHRAIARVLGLAGSGYEAVLATLLKSGDEVTVREALRALARIGTPRAAAIVAAEVGRSRGWLAAAAEETLWHFPGTEVTRHVRELLGRSDFVVRQPQTAARLLDRAVQTDAGALVAVLPVLAAYRFRFWKPSLARLGRRARALMAG